MKYYILVIVCVIMSPLIMAGCSEASEEIVLYAPETEKMSAVPETTAASREMMADDSEAFSETERTVLKAETILTETEPETENENYETFSDTELDEMDAVDNAIQELMQSKKFKASDTAEKAEVMLQLLNDLAEKGTDEFAYPLIKKQSMYYDGGDMISFIYSCGVLGGVKLEPFDPMFN